MTVSDAVSARTGGSYLRAVKADLRDAIADLATRAELSAIRDAIAGMRWTIGLLAAFMFAIGLRVFGLL